MFIIYHFLSLFQDSPPYPLYLHNGVAEHPHIVNILKLQLQHSQIVALGVFSRLPLLKLFRYKLRLPLNHHIRITLLYKNHTIIYHLQISEIVHGFMLRHGVLLHWVLLVREHLQALHAKQDLN